tara:strand:+ start:2150 stop:2371 length:222 start_codon:yes stop_codon:yes gene_type:complete
MNLEKVLQIASECVDNVLIETNELTLSYKLDEEIHKKLDEELFLYKNNGVGSFVHNEIVEIKIADIIFLFLIK